jgi:hypothetical protein
LNGKQLLPKGPTVNEKLDLSVEVFENEISKSDDSKQTIVPKLLQHPYISFKICLIIQMKQVVEIVNTHNSC